MKRFLTNTKIYIILFLIGLIAFLSASIFFKNRNFKKLHEKLAESLLETERQKKILEDEKKVNSFEVADIKENVDVLMDFRTIDEKIKNEKEKDEKPNDSDTFTFSA